MNNDPILAAVYFTKGLGDLVMSQALDVAPRALVQCVDDRFAILAAHSGDVEALANQVSTADDVRLVVAGPGRMANPDDLRGILSRARQAIETIVSTDGRGDEAWSVTVSARSPAWKGKSPWDPSSIVAEILHGADLRGTARSPVDVRLQIDGTEGHVALNLSRRPVEGTSESIWPGALRRSVAAAMVLLACNNASASALRAGIYDPFCGSGTVLTEVARRGLIAFGSDIDERAVTMTRARLGLRGSEQRIFQNDILRTPNPRRVATSCIVSNLPWGKQVAITRKSELFDAVAKLVVSRRTNGSVAVLLTDSAQQLMARIRKADRGVQIQTKQLSFLGQAPQLLVVT